jgi:hypothetical protein
MSSSSVPSVNDALLQKYTVGVGNILLGIEHEGDENVKALVKTTTERLFSAPTITTAGEVIMAFCDSLLMVIHKSFCEDNPLRFIPSTWKTQLFEEIDKAAWIMIEHQSFGQLLFKRYKDMVIPSTPTYQSSSSQSSFSHHAPSYPVFPFPPYLPPNKDEGEDTLSDLEMECDPNTILDKEIRAQALDKAMTMLNDMKNDINFHLKCDAISRLILAIQGIDPFSYHHH